jgi:hypothetical protein
MVGCFGRAKPDQTIRLDLDNELEGMSSISSTNPALIIRCPILPPIPHRQASRHRGRAIPIQSRSEAARQESDRQGS